MLFNLALIFILFQVQVKPDKVEILKYEGDSETTLEFGSQMIGALSA